jgi:hypothetical protein
LTGTIIGTGGWAWKMFESRKSPKPEKCLYIAQNLQVPVHLRIMETIIFQKGIEPVPRMLY